MERHCPGDTCDMGGDVTDPCDLCTDEREAGVEG